MKKTFLTVTTAAKYLGISPDTLRNWDSQDKLKSARTKGGSRRYSLKDLTKFKQEHLPKKVRQLGLLSVSDAAAALNITADTLRNWEKKGITDSIRTQGGTRRFSRSEIRRLQKELGITTEIKKQPRKIAHAEAPKPHLAAHHAPPPSEHAHHHTVVRSHESGHNEAVPAMVHHPKRKLHHVLIPTSVLALVIMAFFIVFPTFQLRIDQQGLTTRLKSMEDRIQNLGVSMNNLEQQTSSESASFVRSQNLQEIFNTYSSVQYVPTSTLASNNPQVERLTAKDAFIGESILDSYGNIYPKGVLENPTKSSLGTWDHRFHGLYLNNFEVTPGGDMTIQGVSNLGDETDDLINFIGRVGTDIVPANLSSLKLGSSESYFNEAFINSVYGHQIDFTDATLSSISFKTAPTTLTGATQALCWDGAADSLIVDCDGSATDLAEYFGSVDPSLEAGDVVVIDAQIPSKDNKSFVVRSPGSYDTKVIGVISTQPNQIYGEGLFTEDENPKPVALAGRVPVKVSDENGAIKAGDYLTSSSIPGIAMKATRPGVTIGKALENYDCTVACSGKILAFINVSFADPENQLVFSSLQPEPVNINKDTLVEDSAPLSVPTSIFQYSAITQTINIFDSLVVIDRKGNITAQTITANEYKVNPNKVTGRAKINMSEKQVTIDNPLVTDKSRILVTPVVDTDLVLAVSSRQIGQQFTVTTSKTTPNDLEFDWWIVNEADEPKEQID